ncbi:hypothetical protein ACIQI8_27520 [Streptomyces sp. NPDC092369]|uniref:hypothetical protein n=1 Tax=Streptomyces sp. NPDC092369 TaxID=3366015 RepID=UPI0038166799
MDTLTSPDPDPIHPATAALPPAVAEPADPPVLPAGPACALCAGPHSVMWQRRPTDDELSEIRKTEEKRRVQALKLADMQQPAPVFPPLPTAGDVLRAVYACAAHAISLDSATLIHLSSCTAPNEADLPGCDCTPEVLPKAPLEDEVPRVRLPEHWLSAGV